MEEATSYKAFCWISFVTTGPSPLVRPEEVDRTLQQQDSGVESVLLYAKAWSKYTKELLAWVEKRISVGELDQSYISNGASKGFGDQDCMTGKN